MSDAVHLPNESPTDFAMTGSFRRAAALSMLLAAGILAGAQLGKIAPLVSWYRDHAGMSLVMAGWLTSAIGFFVAVAALPAAFLIDRVGLYRSFAASAAVLAAGSLALALFHAPAAILAARLVEGLGYLALVIATPALLTVVPPERLRAPALAIWGGFVPMGFAVSDLLASLMLPGRSPDAFLLTIALAFAASAVAAVLLTAGLAPRPAADATAGGDLARHIRRSMVAPIVLSALAFGCYVLISLGFFTFLPIFVAERGMLLLPAWLVVLLVPVGNIVTGILVRARGAAFVVRLAALSFAVMALMAPPFYAAPGPVAATAAALAFAFAHGVLASAIFASVPLLLPAGGSAAIAIGIIAQTGGLATLVGPPIAGHVIATYGWPVFGLYLAAAAVAGLLLLVPILSERRAVA